MLSQVCNNKETSTHRKVFLRIEVTRRRYLIQLTSNLINTKHLPPAKKQSLLKTSFLEKMDNINSIIKINLVEHTNLSKTFADYK